MPPSPLMQAPMGSTGPASPPTDNAGSGADGMSKVREAIKLLEMALPSLPSGSEPHKVVLQCITSLAKIAPASAEVPGIQNTQLMGLQQKAQQSAPMMALMRAMGSTAGPGGDGGAPPAAGPEA